MGGGGLPEVSVIPRCPLLRGIRASTLPVHIQSCVYNYTTVGVLCRCNHTIFQQIYIPRVGSVAPDGLRAV